MTQSKATYSQPTKQPTRKMTAAGAGGLLAGVPIGTYLGGFCGGLLNYYKPELYAVLSGSMDVEAAIAGLVTLAITFASGYMVKEYA